MSAAIPKLPPTAPAGSGATIGGEAIRFGVPSDIGAFTEVWSGPEALAIQTATGFAGVDGVPGTEMHAMHNPERILASVDSQTMAITCDSRGLSYVARLPAAADMETELIATGVIGGSSIGFVATECVWSIDPLTGRNLRTITEGYIIEISAVSAPAYPYATCAQVGGSPRSLAPPSRAKIAESIAKNEARVRADGREAVPAPGASGWTSDGRRRLAAARERIAAVEQEALGARAVEALGLAVSAREKASWEIGLNALSKRVGQRLSAETVAAITAARDALEDLLGDYSDTAPGPRPHGTQPAGTNPDDSGVSTGDVGQPYAEPAPVPGDAPTGTSPRGRRSGARLSKATRDALTQAMAMLKALMDQDAQEGMS